MTTVSCPACAHDFDVKVVVGVARAKPATTVLDNARQEVAAYLADRTAVAPGGRLRAADVFADYLGWAPGKPLSAKAFGMGMRANGVEWLRNSRGTSYTGLRLLEP